MDPLVIVLVLALGCATYITWLVARLSRLHKRVDSAARALWVAGARRAHLAQEWVKGLEAEQNPHPLSAQFAQLRTIAESLTTDGISERIAAENTLTRTLRSLRAEFSFPPKLSDANRRLAIARQVYNDAVRDTLAVRRARIPRALRLSVGNPRPEYADFDTELG